MDIYICAYICVYIYLESYYVFKVADESIVEMRISWHQQGMSTWNDDIMVRLVVFFESFLQFLQNHLWKEEKYVPVYNKKHFESADLRCAEFEEHETI